MTTATPYRAAAFSDLTITPAPASLTPEQAERWRVSGTHRIEHPDGRIEVCGCGPSNHLSGPRWAIVRGVEITTPTDRA